LDLYYANKLQLQSQLHKNLAQLERW